MIPRDPSGTMQGDVCALPVIIWTLPSSGVPKFNPELRSVWGEHAVALTCAQRKQLQQKVLISKANPASEAEWEALAKEVRHPEGMRKPDFVSALRWSLLQV
ncbi:unnamed protein product [Polarella glacialis]|uniref:Uncharacterized protein n=1 Tax=Polarella glacialis TaxID=89957 RepID=A0A813FNP4_POLGL|nr:unnamed protein product [Polarella glacialis]